MTEFIAIPIPARFVTRVMGCVAQWEDDEKLGNESAPREPARGQPSRPVESRAEVQAQPRTESVPGSTASWSDQDGAVWPRGDLLRIANSPVKSLVILQRILDLLSTEPGRRFDPDELERAVEGGNPPYTRSSMFNAIGKLGPHFRKHYRREDLPFVREGEPGYPRFYMSPAQADAWLAVRGAR